MLLRQGRAMNTWSVGGQADDTLLLTVTTTRTKAILHAMEAQASLSMLLCPLIQTRLGFYMTLSIPFDPCISQNRIESSDCNADKAPNIAHKDTEKPWQKQQIKRFRMASNESLSIKIKASFRLFRTIFNIKASCCFRG